MDAFKAFEIENQEEVKGGTLIIKEVKDGGGGTTDVIYYDDAFPGATVTYHYSAAHDGNPK